MGTAVTTTIEIRVASLLQTLTDFFKGPSGPKCPECGSNISGELCPNLDCPIKVAQWITRWCSRFRSSAEERPFSTPPNNILESKNTGILESGNHVARKRTSIL